jgi:hypothetical protein
MIRRRCTLIIAATAALLALAVALVVFSGNNDKTAPSVSPGSQYGDGAAEMRSPRRHDYGQGYESRHRRPSSDQTDSTTHPAEEKTP